MRSSFAHRAMTIAWPAFLMAGVLEMLVFSVVDPGTLHWFGSDPITLSRTAIYSLAFFVFWLAISLAGALTALLQRTPDELNETPSRMWPG